MSKILQKISEKFHEKFHDFLSKKRSTGHGFFNDFFVQNFLHFFGHFFGDFLGDFFRKFFRKFYWSFIEDFWEDFLEEFFIKNNFLSRKRRLLHHPTRDVSLMHSSSVLWAHRAHVSEQLHVRERPLSRWHSINLYKFSKSSIDSSITKLILFYTLNSCSLCNLSLSPGSATMHVGDRSTWLNSGDFSFEK